MTKILVLGKVHPKLVYRQMITKETERYQPHQNSIIITHIVMQNVEYPNKHRPITWLRKRTLENQWKHKRHKQIKNCRRCVILERNIVVHYRNNQNMCCSRKTLILVTILHRRIYLVHYRFVTTWVCKIFGRRIRLAHKRYQRICLRHLMITWLRQNSRHSTSIAIIL